MVARPEEQERRLIQDMPELKDDVARNLYEAVREVSCLSFLQSMLLLLYRVDETTVPPVLSPLLLFSHSFSFSNIHTYISLQTITFPECEGHFLADCLEILNQELYQLQLDAEIVVHEKRNIDQSGYNKVVIVTD
jgi:hypothetical protein